MVSEYLGGNGTSLHLRDEGTQRLCTEQDEDAAVIKQNEEGVVQNRERATKYLAIR